MSQLQQVDAIFVARTATYASPVAFNAASLQLMPPMPPKNEPGFEFEGPQLLASAVHAQLLARRRATLEHDLKNIVHGLLSGTELLGKSLTTASARISPTECLGLLQQQLARTQSALTHMLDEIAPLPAATTAIDLSALLNECLHAVRHQLQALELATTIESDVTIRGQRTRLKDVLLCALLDCADAAPQRSKLTVSATPHSDGKALLRIQHVQEAAQPRSAVMSFLGELLNIDDASLEIDSSATERTVSILLPLAARASPMQSPSQSSPKLLIVDANHDAADSLAMLIQLEGFDATAAYDVEAAWQSVRASAPSAVLIDLDGSVDSATFIGKLRHELKATTRVIGLTHSSERKSTADVDAQLRKPLDPAALLSLLKT